MGTHPIFESDFDCLTDMNTNNHTISSSKIFPKEKPKPYMKTIDLSNNDVIKLADLQELPILVDLNSSTESASSASSSGSTNTTDSNESGCQIQPYQFYFGKISTSEVENKPQLDISLPELEEISNSTLPDFTLYNDATNDAQESVNHTS